MDSYIRINRKYSYRLSKQNDTRLQEVKFTFTCLLALPLLLFVYALRPVVKIRFGEIISDRFGHFALEPELYCSEKEKGVRPGGTWDLFFFHEGVINSQLAKMWKQVLPIHEITRYMAFLNNLELHPKYEEHIVFRRHSRDLHRVLSQTECHLQWETKEKKKGERLLEQLGVPHKEPFVCFHFRESEGYYADSNFHYQSKWNFRNSDIKTTIYAMEELANRGYYVLRMGRKRQSKLDSNHPGIIDYATSELTSDFFDIYLWAHCKFYVGDTSGGFSVAKLFRKPIVIVNLIPMQRIRFDFNEHLTIPKKLYSHNKGRLLTFEEIVRSEIGMYLSMKDYKDDHIEIRDNNEDEIRDVVIEMEERLKGEWEKTALDKKLQQKVRDIYPDVNKFSLGVYPGLSEEDRLRIPEKKEARRQFIDRNREFFRGEIVHYPYFGRIGAEYLRNNVELIQG